MEIWNAKYEAREAVKGGHVFFREERENSWSKKNHYFFTIIFFGVDLHILLELLLKTLTKKTLFFIKKSY